jgi:hypothetical protein
MHHHHQSHDAKDGQAVHGHGAVVLVDAANVAYENRNARDSKPALANIEKMQKRLEGLGFHPILIADADLQYEIDQAGQLRHLEQSGQIYQSPANTQADYFLLRTAEHDGVPLISNDLFRDRAQEFPTAVKHLRVPYMIINGEVEIDQELLHRAIDFARQRGSSAQQTKKAGTQKK